MRKSFPLLLLLSLVTGCVSRVTAPYMVKPGITNQQQAADTIECREQSLTPYDGGWIFGPAILILPYMAVHNRNVKVEAENEATQKWSLCMQARGYYSEEQLKGTPPKDVPSGFYPTTTGFVNPRGKTAVVHTPPGTCSQLGGVADCTLEALRPGVQGTAICQGGKVDPDLRACYLTWE